MTLFNFNPFDTQPLTEFVIVVHVVYNPFSEKIIFIHYNLFYLFA